MDHLVNQALINNIQPKYVDMPLAIFLLGTNGGGKSTLRNYLNLSDIQTNIDPDVLNRIFKLQYPKNYLIEAAKQALNLYYNGIKNGLNICIESTLSGHGTIERMKLAKSSGYFLIGYFVGLNDVKLNIERIKNRVTIGGHNIPDAIVKKRYTESIINFLKVKDLFSELHIIDNSGDSYNMQISKYEAKLIRRTTNLEPWAENLQLLTSRAKNL